MSASARTAAGVVIPNGTGVPASTAIKDTAALAGNTINATLLGQTIPFATPGAANVWGGFGGLGRDQPQLRSSWPC